MKKFGISSYIFVLILSEFEPNLFCRCQRINKPLAKHSAPKGSKILRVFTFFYNFQFFDNRFINKSDSETNSLNGKKVAGIRAY